MKTSTKIVLITIPIAILAVLAASVGPLGGFWAPAPSMPVPSGYQVPLFMFLVVAESIALGLGISFLFFGYPMVKNFAPQSNGLARAAHLAMTWMLIEWWPHDNLHLHVGESSLDVLLFIEYVFHFSIIVCGLILIGYFLSVFRAQKRVLV